MLLPGLLSHHSSSSIATSVRLFGINPALLLSSLTSIHSVPPPGLFDAVRRLLDARRRHPRLEVAVSVRSRLRSAFLHTFGLASGGSGSRVQGSTPVSQASFLAARRRDSHGWHPADV